MRVLAGQALLQQRVQRGTVPVCVRLPASSGLRTEINLPQAVEQNLGQVLLFELDRRTPFTPDAVHFAHRVLAREAGQLRIELTVAPKPVVAEAVALAEKLGLAVSAVEIAGEAGGTASGNLLPLRQTGARPMRRALRIGGVAAAAAAMVAIYLPVYEAHHAAVELTSEVAEARALADRVQKLKTDLAALETADQFLTAAKTDRPSVSELLFEVTHTLPDDTWLVDFGIAGDELKIAGFTASSSDLIQRVGRSRLLGEPRFRSAVTVDTAAHRERFEIGAKIARKPSS
jgi:general secretion pathway protein L